MTLEQEFEGKLFQHIFFISVRGDLLPHVSYYTVKNGKCLLINPETFEEQESGDDLIKLFGECKNMGEYDAAKIVKYDVDYIPYDRLVMKLRKWIVPNKALEKTPKDGE